MPKNPHRLNSGRASEKRVNPGFNAVKSGPVLKVRQYFTPG
jgi:hypothetical protein